MKLQVFEFTEDNPYGKAGDKFTIEGITLTGKQIIKDQIRQIIFSLKTFILKHKWEYKKSIEIRPL
jgi:hypothetical protein